jgi:hypothetical protein
MAIGCAQTPMRPQPAGRDEDVDRASYESLAKPDVGHATEASTKLAASPAELAGPQPVEVYIRRALAETRTVRAAFHNVRSLQYRLPQVTALDDPVASNAVFPIPAVAPVFVDGLQPL